MASCCAITMFKASMKPAAPAQFRRYRRSSVCRAPRKRTFIANMQKFIIEAELPSGLAGESFFGASTLCPINRDICGRSAVVLPQAAIVSPMLVMAYGGDGNDGNGRGNGRGDGYNNGDDDNDMGEQLSVLPLAVAVALCAALYPTLEGMVAPEAPKMQLAVAPAAALVVAAEKPETLSFNKAFAAALLSETSEVVSEELVLTMA